ncbi:MAG: M20 family metallopeptidase [Firmicutes bacterium]|nr:M20 family metallopeptidase [Bacillota bacterium]
MNEKLLQAAQEIRNDVVAMSDAIYERPELGYEEFNSARLHAELLAKYGFAVEKPFMGLDTGYKAVYDSGKPGPAICYMAEYDALPGVGHGCGHNMLGSTSAAAGIILSKVIDEIGGKVVVMGTPAEETSGAKVMYADKGAFEGIDAAIVEHPDNGHYKSGRSLALTTVEAIFTGKPAHAATAPHMGVNALDAATISFVAVGVMRQQTRPDARIHGIITEGGVAPNVIPERCVMRWYVRAGDRKYREELLERVKNCFRGAALATGCELEMHPFEDPYDDLMTNETLSELMTESLYEVGVETVQEPRPTFGSLDAGNVSYVAPTIHPYFPITTDKTIASHTREFASCTLTDYAKDSMMQTATAMALCGYKLITQPETLAKVKAEFEENTK